MKKISHSLYGHKIFLTLVLFGFIYRLMLIHPDIIPFTFDHGKDSLAVLHMLKTFSPKFIGPWTSIPGLYFGPAWYYLIAPAYLISNGHPMSPVFLIAIVTTLLSILAYKHLGKLEALLILFSAAWIGISTSAWNPFPIAWTTLLIIIVLSKLKPNTSISPTQLGLITFFASLGLHFSSAYAAFFIITIPLIILYRIKIHHQSISIRTAIFGLIGFIIPFIPQIIFEFRHDFIQSKSVVRFIVQKSNTDISINFVDVIRKTFDQFFLSVFPHFPEGPEYMFFIYFVIFLWLISWAVYKKKKPKLLVEMLILIIIPIIGISRLHFNTWYLTAMIPIFIFLGAELIRFQPKKFQLAYLILLTLAPALSLYHHGGRNAELLSNKRDFLPAKLKAIEYIYNDSENKKFSSYQYAPHIYDFDWQYLYFWYIYKGYPIPEEFSYQPKAITYITEKQELLASLGHSQSKPDYIYFIIEKESNQEYLKQWWDKQNFSEIIDHRSITDEIEVYKAIP